MRCFDGKREGIALKILVGLLLSLNSGPIFAKYDAEIYAKNQLILDAAISPDGSKLAVINIDNDGSLDETYISIFDANTLKPLKVLKQSTYLKPLVIHFSSNNRIVFQSGDRAGGNERYKLKQKIYAVDVNGQNFETLIGGPSSYGIINELLHKAGEITASVKSPDRYSAEIINSMASNSGDILIRLQPHLSDGSRDFPAKLFQLNIYTSVLLDVDLIPASKSIVFDHYWNPSYFWVNDLSNNATLYRFDKELGVKEEWSGISVNQLRWYPIGHDNRTERIYVLDERDNGLAGLYLKDQLSDDKDLIYRSESVDVLEEDISYASNIKLPISMLVRDGLTTTEVIAKKEKEAKLIDLLRLVEPFPSIALLSANGSGTKGIMAAAYPGHPRRLYLVDLVNNAVKLLYRSKDVEAQGISVPTSVVIEARDGLKLYGYLTSPLMSTDRSTLVVLIHGGPYGVRDTDEYDSDVQFLAHNGVSVLQVNFRGSLGYGRDFLNKGYGEWGKKMQNDISDSVKWAQQTSKNKYKQVCFMGHSYGGYASLWGAIQEPELVNCVIASMGVYDLTLLAKRDQSLESQFQVNFINRQFHGRDEAIALSPVNFVSKLKAKVLIVHGKKDSRVPFEHFQLIEKAMRVNRVDYKKLVFPGEDHGYVNPENKEEFYEEAMDLIIDAAPKNK